MNWQASGLISTLVLAWGCVPQLESLPQALVHAQAKPSYELRMSPTPQLTSISPPTPSPGWQLLVATPAEERPPCPPYEGVAPTWNREARVVPAFKDGRTTGFKVFAISPRSALHEAGFCNLDVVVAVNGYPMSNIGRALGVLEQLRVEPRYTIELLREEELLVLELERPRQWLSD